MSFTVALYYPWIDINDESWLKSAALYWETIRTIVPESIHEPYSTRTALEFQDAGVLVPLRVHSRMNEIEGLAEDILNYLSSPEAAEMLVADRLPSCHRVHVDKLPETLHRLARINPDKLPYEVQRILERAQGALGYRRDGWYNVDERFASFYMTLLATRLSERIGAGLLTDFPASNRLSVSAKLDAQQRDLFGQMRRRREFDAYPPRRTIPSTLAQGMLVNLIMKKIGIDPETPPGKILKFREDHAVELGRLREKIGSLTESISSDSPIEHLQQRAHDVYQNSVLPALHSLERGLTASAIR